MNYEFRSDQNVYTCIGCHNHKGLKKVSMSNLNQFLFGVLCIYLVIRCFAHWCDQSWEIFMFGIKSSEAVSRTYWLMWLIMPVHLVFDTPTYSCMTFEGLLRFLWHSELIVHIWTESHQHTLCTNISLLFLRWKSYNCWIIGSSSWAIEVHSRVN